MELEFGKSIDNNILDYPLWALILGSVVMILLTIGHIIRFKQSSKKAHIFFALCLICSTVQYVFAIQSIRVAFLTIIADIIALIANIMLLCIWINSMEKHVGTCALTCYGCIIYVFLLSFMILVIETLIALDSSLFFEANNEPEDVDLILWRVTLISLIAGSTILILSTLLFQCCFCSEEYLGKSQKQLQLVRLSLLSLVLLASKLGTLFGIPLLYIIPFLLFHTIPMLKSNSITSYYYTPEDAHNADAHYMKFFGCTRVSNV
jgi:hypothetical protein